MRVLDFCFALRPLVLIPAWSFFLIGRGTSATEPFPWLRLVVFTSVMAGVHLVNQVVDAESDRINGKGFFLQRGVFARRDYIVAAVLAIGAALGVALARRDAPGLVAVAAALGLAYSLPPLRLTARPGLDVIANAIGYGTIAPMLGGAPRPSLATGASTLVFATTLAVAAVFLHTTLLDLEGDRRTGKRTTGVVLGATVTRSLAFLAALGAAVCSTGQGPTLRIATALLSVASLATILLPARVTSRAIVVGATALFAIVAATAWPPFLLWIFALAIATRVYYARRFALRYPAL